MFLHYYFYVHLSNQKTTAVCIFVILMLTYSYTVCALLIKIIIIIMVISKCYFSREHISISCRNGVNIELGKTNRLKALRMMQNNT